MHRKCGIAYTEGIGVLGSDLDNSLHQQSQRH